MNPSPVTRPLAGVFAVAALLLTACGASGHSHVAGSSSSAGAEPGVDSYLCSGSTSDDLLQWRDSSGYLSGTYQYADISGQAPDEQVSSNSGDLSGTLEGTAITLNIGLSQSLYGNLSNGQLTLNVPQSDGTIQAATCNAATVSDWNTAVASLDNQATGDNNAASQAQQQAQHQQDVSNAQQALSGDISALTSDSSSLNNDNSLANGISQMKSDYATEQKDWGTEQSASCSDGSVSYDASQVSYDQSQVSYDQSQVNYDIQQLGTGAVQSDLARVSNDLATLKNLGASPGTDPSSAVAAGNQALKNAANAVSWAQGQANTVNGEAQQLATTAQNYASSHCG